MWVHTSQCRLGVYIMCLEVVHSKKVVEFDAMYGDVGSHNNLLYWCIVLQVHSVVTQFGIVCVGLLLLILYYSRALFYFCTPPHSLFCISAYHTTVSHIKFCFVTYESLHVVVFVFQVSFELDLVWCWGTQQKFFVLVYYCYFAQCLDIHNSVKKNH